MEVDVVENEFGFSKPIIAIKPRGSKRASRKAKAIAGRVVSWKTSVLTLVIQRRAF